MLLEQPIISTDSFNNKNNRFDELVNQYEEPVRALVHKLLEEYVEHSFREFMGNRIGEIVTRESDGLAVKDYRNGHREINQAVVDSLILNNFRIPRNRAGGFRPEILARRGKRIVGKFAELARELFVNGVSTRKIRRSFERAGMKISGLSKSTVSTISKDLLKEYMHWINKPIIDKFVYLQADGVYINVRKSSPRKQGTLLVTGITAKGQKEVLYFTLGNESRTNFDEVLQNMIRRGLKTDAVSLVTVDGAQGPISSIVDHFGKRKLQRCTVHKNRNILSKCPKNLRDELKAKLNRLWNQPSKFAAEQYLEELKNEYGLIAQNAIDSLVQDKDSLFRFFDFPEEHRKTIRNTNLIERVIHEVRRRTKVMNTVDTEHGAYGILMGIVREQNERWSKRSHWRKS